MIRLRKRYILFSALIGAAIVAIVSASQKIAMGYSMTPVGFVVPSLVGFLSGAIIGTWHSKVLFLKQELECSHASQVERYHNIINTAPVGIFESTPDGRYRTINEKFAAMLGYRKEELLDNNINIADLCFDKKAREEVKRLLAAHGELNNYHLLVRRKDGSLMWMSIFAKVQSDEMGSYNGGFALDITAQKEAQIKLAQTLEEFEILFSNSQVGIMLLREGRFIQKANQRLAEILGYDSIYEMIGMSMGEIHVNKEVSIEFGQKNSAQVQGRQIQVEHQLKRKDGTSAWCLLSGKVVDSSRILARDGEVVWIVDDISARKRIEERMRLQALVLDQIADMVVLTDLDGIITYLNKAVIRFLGYPSEEIVGKSIEMFGDNVEQGATQKQILEQTLRDGYWRGLVVNYSADGKEILLDSRIQTIDDDQGNPFTLVGISTDVTAQKQYERSLLQAKDQAESANRAKSEFLANMSHEIRTPINGIMGMLQLLQTTPVNDEQGEYVSLALQSSRRLTQLLTDILDLARVEAGKLDVTLENFDFWDAINSVTQLFAPTASEKSLELRITIHPDIPKILKGDSLRLQQVLSNLVGNAIKFTDTGHVEIEIQSLPARDGEIYPLLFSVTDTGVGIPEDKLESLFRPFSQVSQGFTRKNQGAGLGLSICKRFIDLMGGNISFESEPSVGTAVYFSIPFSLAEPVNEKKHSGQPQSSRNTELFNLFAEDDAVNRLATTLMLEMFGHRVVAVADGYQALDALKHDDFDIVLMDIQMPGMDGMEATKSIRAGNVGKDKTTIPIIALTAYSMAGDKERFIEAGMDGYLSKPVEIDALKNILSETLENRDTEM